MYSRTYFGTKHLIEDYLREVVLALEYLCKDEKEYLSRNSGSLPAEISPLITDGQIEVAEDHLPRNERTSRANELPVSLGNHRNSFSEGSDSSGDYTSIVQEASEGMWEFPEGDEYQYNPKVNLLSLAQTVTGRQTEMSGGCRSYLWSNCFVSQWRSNNGLLSPW